MILIILLIALVGERFLLEYQSMRNLKWFDELNSWYERQVLPDWMLNGFGGVLILLLPPLLFLGLIQHLLNDTLWGIPEAIFAIIILLMSFGPDDLDEQVRHLNDADDNHDTLTATALARELVGNEPPTSEPAYTQAAIEGILEQANNRIFAIIFWFLVLGPIGAALYRLATRLPLLQTDQRKSSFLDTSRLLLAILNWIPARLTAATYAIAGSFEDALHGWRNYHENRFNEFTSNASGILICTGTGALRLPSLIDEQNGGLDRRYLLDASMGLVWRSLVVWMVLITLFTLAGWL